MAFLSDAQRERGVLRQNGASYQFRHFDLQRRLVANPGLTQTSNRSPAATR
jgi:hypothetical protein